MTYGCLRSSKTQHQPPTKIQTNSITKGKSLYAYLYQISHFSVKKNLWDFWDYAPHAYPHAYQAVKMSWETPSLV